MDDAIESYATALDRRWRDEKGKRASANKIWPLFIGLVTYKNFIFGFIGVFQGFAVLIHHHDT